MPPTIKKQPALKVEKSHDEKRIIKLKQRLEQIEKLRIRQERGETLEDNQVLLKI